MFVVDVETGVATPLPFRVTSAYLDGPWSHPSWQRLG